MMESVQAPPGLHASFPKPLPFRFQGTPRGLLGLCQVIINIHLLRPHGSRGLKGCMLLSDCPEFHNDRLRTCCPNGTHADHVRNGLLWNLSMPMEELLNVPDQLALSPSRHIHTRHKHVGLASAPVQPFNGADGLLRDPACTGLHFCLLRKLLLGPLGPLMNKLLLELLICCPQPLNVKCQLVKLLLKVLLNPLLSFIQLPAELKPRC